MLPGRRLWEFVGSDYFIPFIFIPFHFLCRFLRLDGSLGLCGLDGKTPACLVLVWMMDGWMVLLTRWCVCPSALLITSNYLLRTVHGLAPIDLGNINYAMKIGIINIECLSVCLLC